MFFLVSQMKELEWNKSTPSQEVTESEPESTLSHLKDLFTMLLHWGLGCWHGYSNSCCSWQGRGAGRHKAWDKSPCPSCISGGPAEGRLPAVAPQAADQVQVDSLHIVILREWGHPPALCPQKSNAAGQDDLSVFTNICWKNLTEKPAQNCLANPVNICIQWASSQKKKTRHKHFINVFRLFFLRPNSVA